MRQGGRRGAPARSTPGGHRMIPLACGAQTAPYAIGHVDHRPTTCHLGNHPAMNARSQHPVVDFAFQPPPFAALQRPQLHGVGQLFLLGTSVRTYPVMFGFSTSLPLPLDHGNVGPSIVPSGFTWANLDASRCLEYPQAAVVSTQFLSGCTTEWTAAPASLGACGDPCGTKEGPLLGRGRARPAARLNVVNILNARLNARV